MINYTYNLFPSISAVCKWSRNEEGLETSPHLIWHSSVWMYKCCLSSHARWNWTQFGWGGRVSCFSTSSNFCRLWFNVSGERSHMLQSIVSFPDLQYEGLGMRLCKVLYCDILILWYTMIYPVMYYAVVYCNILWYTVIYYDIPWYPVMYYIWYTVVYCNILWYTVEYCSMSNFSYMYILTCPILPGTSVEISSQHTTSRLLDCAL